MRQRCCFTQRLKNELHAIYEDAAFHKPPGALLQFITENDLSQTEPQVWKLRNFMPTIPVTSVAAEPSFSCLKRMKTYLRNTMGQNTLSALACMSMESTLLPELKSNGCFHGSVIDSLARMKDGRMGLL
ncbi:UNVERIFIED_CONTAM: hypothetical protein FKN15_009836 [Acipenser sinensis]